MAEHVTWEGWLLRLATVIVSQTLCKAIFSVISTGGYHRSTTSTTSTSNFLIYQVKQNILYPPHPKQSAQTKDFNSFHPLSYHCSQVYNKKAKSSHRQIWDGQAGYIQGNAFTSIWFNHPFKESILFICFSSHLSTRMSWWSLLSEIGQIPSNWISLSINNPINCGFLSKTRDSLI